MKYSIIIPTYNHLEDCLKPCIQSILDFTTPEDLEVIVVANGCTDGTRAYLESLPNHFKILWFDEALGYTKATNEGIKVSQGEYLVLLNNDCILLGQEKNTWLNMLIHPFITEEKVGLTGVSKLLCNQTNRKFLIFFCVMIPRIRFQEFGLLDEIFSPGGGEDTDFCIRVENAGYKLRQVPEELTQWAYATNFPIYHKAEGTFSTYPGWQAIFDRNSEILRKRYSIQQIYGNNFERAVIDNKQEVPPREAARYKWARENIVGKKVLEIGCSSGYGLRFLKDVPGLDYLGIDYNKEIVEYAINQFGPYFKQADINTFEFEQYDTIIAFEILEHIPNGKEMAQKLKQYCKCLLATCPYNETPGFWGEHHVLHHLTEKDFPNFNYSFIDDNGNVGSKPHNTLINLMMMKWLKEQQEYMKIPMAPTVTAYITSKDRYYTTLPMAISSIINQTVLPQKLIIFLDGEHVDLRENSIYKNLLALIEYKGIAWELLFSLQKGQVHNHQYMSQLATTDWIWRLDDDCIAENNVLETLLKHTEDNTVGAVATVVIDPKSVSMLPPFASNSIRDVSNNVPNIQWFKHPTNDVKDVEHLYSSFLYRKTAGSHGYCTQLSPVGHREETIFTYEMKRKGWKLLVDPSAITWHVREPIGGIRAYNNPEYFDHDEKIFVEKMREWKLIESPNYKLIILDNGLGDHFAFKSVLPEIRTANPDKKIIIAVCYPKVFEDEKDITIISIEDAKRMVPNIEQYNVYKFCWEKNWDKSILDAYRGLYL